MRGSLPRKAMLSYCILGILSAFSHSAIAHGPEKITPIENDEQFLTGVPDPNTRNANQEGLRGILNSNPFGVADGGLTGQRTNSPAPATAATSGENAAVLPTPPAAAASPTVAAGSSKATSVTTTEPVAVTAHKESAAVPPTPPAAAAAASPIAVAGSSKATPVTTTESVAVTAHNESAAVPPTLPAAAASPIAVAGSSKATFVTTTEPVAVTAHNESAAVPPTHAIDTLSPAAPAENLMAPPAATPAPATAAVIKDPSSASDAESDNEKSQDKRRSKKKKKLKQAALNHAKGTGHAEDNAKTAADASVKHKSSVQNPAQSAGQTLEQEQAAMNARRPVDSVAANAGNLTLAAGSSPSAVAQQRHGAALSRGQNINQASNPEDMFTYDPQTGVMHVGENAVGTTISIAGRQGDRGITGLADGVHNNDAANVGQLNRVNNTATSAQALAQKNTARIKDIENKLSKTNTKIDRGLAASAALTGLFQPYGVGKINFTAGMGGYGSSQAIAVGSGYRISENTAFKAGVAYSGGSNVMYNASFNLEW
ncbi:Putative YadA-like adhesin [Sodalis praecaptivus]|uniref:Putative YadA-like adhesin n=2 Tax=Bruguierivoracaceae TaxID=2812006 RepID=W0HY61_9GAMM|nr:Putative YadA-like adhesin [Sodalis praecaptivus]